MCVCVCVHVCGSVDKLPMKFGAVAMTAANCLIQSTINKLFVLLLLVLAKGGKSGFKMSLFST